MTRTACLLVCAIGLLGACGTPASSPPTTDAMLHVAPDAAVDGPGLSVGAALGGDGSRVLVRGMLLIDPDGTAWLCSALAESFPPQCAGERLEVVDLANATALPELTVANGVRWSEAEVGLFGTIR